MTKENALNAIKKLVSDFEDNLASAKDLNKFGETETRIQYINPFFKALGWNVDNQDPVLPESHKEIVHETDVTVKEKGEKKNKKPDYGFRKEGNTIFFVDAKKPGINIKTDSSTSFQIRRYGWSAKHAIAIVTDFEEFAIYETTIEPKHTDKPIKCLSDYFTYKQYVEKFDFIWDLLHKDNVYAGSIDIYAKTDKRGKDTVDNKFLDSLESWRKQLAIKINEENKNLSEAELNFAVQQNIDRIIFLRIAESKEIEPYEQLKSCLNSKNIYDELLRIFDKAEQKYNSGLFDFKKVDKISKNIIIPNKVLTQIINDLYYPNSSYAFDVLPIEIIGHAYEQFLGSIIRLTKGQNAKVEPKPEVRKAGGVFYTPERIVKYICQQSIDSFIKGKKPDEISKIKIVDPACGSGSFLIGAYTYLLNYHLDYYTELKRNGKKVPELNVVGKLTNEVKKKILTNNIFGADIDSNAVEVAKLSLLLKCMEEETKGTIDYQLKFFHERVLPTLDNNIKCGNSLVDNDYYDSELDFGDEKTAHPFNWKKEFESVFKQGGFDVVVGNPPYVLLEGEFRNDDMITYFRKKYASASYKIDLYHLFIERGLYLLKENGKLGFITPSNFLSNNGLVSLRETILEKSYIDVLNVISGKVFIGASVDTTISILQKSTNKKKSSFIHSDWKRNSLVESTKIVFDQNNFATNEGKIFISTGKKTKFKVPTSELGENYSVKFGMQLRDRKKFLADVITKDDKKLITKFHRPCYTGKNVGKYDMNYSNMLAYFNREAKSGGCWDEKIHNANPKIIVRQIGLHPICAIDLKGYCCLNTVFMIATKAKTEINLKFILGILNSKFMAEYWQENFSDKRQTFPKIKGSYLEKLPIPVIELSNKKSKQLHDDVVKYIDTILTLREDVRIETLKNKIDQINSRIEHCEEQIDNLVNEIYGL